MPESIMAEICEQYRNTHENLLDLIVNLTDEQMSGIWHGGQIFFKS